MNTILLQRASAADLATARRIAINYSVIVRPRSITPMAYLGCIVLGILGVCTLHLSPMLGVLLLSSAVWCSARARLHTEERFMGILFALAAIAGAIEIGAYLIYWFA